MASQTLSTNHAKQVRDIRFWLSFAGIQLARLYAFSRTREFNDFANSAIYTVSPTGTCMISASAGRTFPQSREEFIAAINRFDPSA